jgi:hypothetical protein
MERGVAVAFSAVATRSKLRVAEVFTAVVWREYRQWSACVTLVQSMAAVETEYGGSLLLV